MRKKQMRAISPNPSRPKDSRRRSLDRRFFQRFASDTHGGVMAYMGIMLPVMLGITGLALDGSLWYAQKRSVQAIADTAAYSVVLEVQRSGDTNLAKTAAKADAVTYGLDEAAGDTITFNIPPKYGTFANTAGYYEVIIERPATIFLAGLLVDNFDTAARAVSGGGAASNPPCLLASDPSQKDAFKVNNGTVSTTGCNIHVNSIDSSALNVCWRLREQRHHHLVPHDRRRIRPRSACRPAGAELLGLRLQQRLLQRRHARYPSRCLLRGNQPVRRRRHHHAAR
jgi:hypothetical protein